MQVPIACSLTPGQAEDRIAEWRALLQGAVEEVDVAGSAARLRLIDGDETLLRVVDLAEREQACCPFFDFRIDLAGGERWLCISVPDKAGALLADLLQPSWRGRPAPPG